MNPQSIWHDVQAIRRQGTLVHNITNYVVMNPTANALLAIGASPVMAHAVEEVEDMVGLTQSLGGALVINIGTLSGPWIEGMIRALRAAEAQHVPIVLDPVGAGATPYRARTCQTLLETALPTVIRGNASEIMALQDADIRTRGVDSAQTTDHAADSAEQLAIHYGCVISVSGAMDLITNGRKRFYVNNDSPLMTRVTGMGCTASALTGAFCAVNRDALAAAAHAMAVMGICGEIAVEQSNGPGTLQLHFYDALHNLSLADIAQRLK